MPRSWLKNVRRRTVENDYNYYDDPATIWVKINQRTWPYATNKLRYYLRDIAYLSTLYLCTARASEICRADLNAGFKKSITKDQFIQGPRFLRVRDLMILKRRELNDKGEWVSIQDLNNYPIRNEILLPLTGSLSRFTKAIINHLELLRPNEELFKFRFQRGWQITETITGETQHYLRDMGIKLYTRLYDRNLADLQKFSGHARIENLVHYLSEGQIEEKLLRFNK